MIRLSWPPKTPLRALIACVALLAPLTACGDGSGSGSTSPSSSPTYALSGSVSHLDTGGVTISDGSETLTVPQGATSFAFTKLLASGSTYAVTVTTQPSGESCTVSNGSGTVNGAVVTNIALVCNTLVSQPLALNVSAVGSLADTSSRIFLPVTQVGNTPPINPINAIVDTGSSGTTLKASDIFPSAMVSTNGFVFILGQTSFTYNGITVTNLVATRIYGSQSTNPVTETGNLGFAQVTFGSGTHVTTAMMPIFLVYQATSANGGALTNFANLIGINSEVEGFAVGEQTATSPAPCTPQSSASCGLPSPFRYLSYADGIDKGFTLNKVTFAACDITTPGSCTSSPSLTVGIASSNSAGFSTIPLSPCRSVTLVGTTTEQACSQVIQSVTVTLPNSSASFTGPAIFDSGFPFTRLSVPATATFPNAVSNGTTVQIAPTSPFSYSYPTGGGYYTTNIVQNATSSDSSNSGIGFFSLNSLLVDYSKSQEGWRGGS